MLPRPNTETVKLRTSCQMCALVKVKCTKEKPTCSRCKNRGIDCQYFVVKRPGRRRQTIGADANGANSANLTSTYTDDSRINGAIQQSSRTSLSPNPSFQDGSSSLPDMRGTAPVTTSIPSATGHNGMNMMTSDHSVLPRNFMSGSLDDDMATIDPLSIFSAFEETSGSISASLMDVSSEMDEFDFFRPPGVHNRVQTPPRDIASLLMPVEDMAGRTPVSELIRAADISLCSNRDRSSSRSGVSSSLFSSAGQIASSLTFISTRRASPSSTSNATRCRCLDEALHLLKKVSGSSSSSSSSASQSSSSSSQSSRAATRVSPASPDDNESSAGFSAIEAQPRWFQAALMENRQCLGAMDGILTCPSTNEDRMLLLLVLCMILLKILDRYSNVAWGRPQPFRAHAHGSTELGLSMGDHMVTEGGMLASSRGGGQDQMRGVRDKKLTTSFDFAPPQHSEDDDLGRATAQLVLGELHRVQRVVNNLLPKLKGPKFHESSQQNQQTRDWSGQQQTTALSMEEPANPGLASPFSASTLEQMVSDTQQGLSNLSSSIIHRLRQS